MAEKEDLGDLRKKLGAARVALAHYHRGMDDRDPDREDIGATVEALARAEGHAAERYSGVGDE